MFTMDYFGLLLSVNRFIIRFKLYVCVVFLLLLVYSYNAREKRLIYYKRKLPDLLEDVQNISSKGKSIFFIETSSKTKDYVIRLSTRQACAVESAAKLNPETTIYVLFTLPLAYPDMEWCISYNCNILRELFKYKNIKMRNINMIAYFKDTPLEQWWQKGKLWKSYNPVEHTSDVMRFLTLWKFGGTYLDLDVVVLKSFENLTPNFAGAQSQGLINSAVINFDHLNFGHEIAELCLREIRYNFRGDLWAHNGPGVITRVLENICNTTQIKQMTPETCHGFRVFPMEAFYPVDYLDWKWSFISAKVDYILEKANQSYAVHFWNKLSSEEKITYPKENDTAYTRLAKTQCPNVFKHVDIIF